MAKIILILIFIVSLSSCGNKERLKIDERGDIEQPNRSNDVIVAPEIVFADVLDQVFQNDCKACHSGYVQYANVKRDINKILKEVLSNSMPQFGPPLNNEQKMLLQQWAVLGAPEN